MKKSFTAYMCLIDFEHERGDPANGNRVYANIEDLRRERSCVEECGIIEVNVVPVKVVLEPSRVKQF